MSVSWNEPASNEPPPVIIYVVDEDTIAVAGRADLTLMDVARLLHQASHNVFERLQETREKAKEN